MTGHLSVVSIQRKFTLVRLPRSTSIPASCVGAVVKSLFNKILLSAIFNCCVLIVVVVPLTTRSPVIKTSEKVGVDDVETSCPIDICPVELS